jgi:cytochrome c oxidase subunit 2
MTARRLKWLSFVPKALLLFVLTGCGGPQSVLNPQGIQAIRLAKLFWIFTGVCGAVWILVLIAMMIAVSGIRAEFRSLDPLVVDAQGERTMTIVVGSLVTLTALILISFTFLSYLATRGLAAPGEALSIEVTGYQWWWNVKYESADPSQVFNTANELHVPVGRPVKIDLKAGDVIHSFWVPNLSGKQDLIPGQDNVLTFTPRRAGWYRGQCAEFCGWQHAHMAFLVIVESQSDFDAWRAAQLETANSLSGDRAAAGGDSSGGEHVFMTRGCALCHAIRGTDAGGRAGPDLTHLASRRTLAAGTLPNTKQDLLAWIADPQAIKPGNKMPKVPLDRSELEALGNYLGTLQ